MLRRIYAGWHIYDDNGPNVPVTGRWSACRFGVWMCHNNEDGLMSMIYARLQENRGWA